MAQSCAVPADPVTGAGFPVVELFFASLFLQSGLAAQQHSLPCFAASAPNTGDTELSATSHSLVVSLRDTGFFKMSCHLPLTCTFHTLCQVQLIFGEYLKVGGLHATLQQAFDMIRRLCKLCHSLELKVQTTVTRQASPTVQNRSLSLLQGLRA